MPADTDPEPVRIVYQYWLKCAAGGWAPAWVDIDLLALPPPLIPYMLVCDATPEGEFVYRYWGRGHTAYHGVDYTGKEISSIRPTWIRELLNHQYMRVLETRQPRVFATHYEKIAEPQYSLRMPLSNDGVRVTGFIGFAERRGAAAELTRWTAAHRMKPVKA